MVGFGFRVTGTVGLGCTEALKIVGLACFGVCGLVQVSGPRLWHS